MAYPQGQFWYHTREQVADMIDSGKYSFHVKVGTYDVPVRTYIPSWGEVLADGAGQPAEPQPVPRSRSGIMRRLSLIIPNAD
jgi:hypothetical protein